MASMIIPVAAAFVAGGAGGLLAGRRQGRIPDPEGSSRPLFPGIDVTATAARDWELAERGRSWQTAAGYPDPDPNPSGAPAGQRHAGGHTQAQEVSRQAAAERAQLVEACADLADRLRDHQPALFAVLRRDLEAVGITMQLADGEVFNAERHNPVGTEPTADPGQDMHVASTMRLGYFDHGVPARMPDVIVYRFGAAANAS